MLDWKEGGVWRGATLTWLHAGAVIAKDFGAFFGFRAEGKQHTMEIQAGGDAIADSLPGGDTMGLSHSKQRGCVIQLMCRDLLNFNGL